MQVLGSRRGGLFTLTVAAIALVVVAAFAIWQLVERPSVNPITPAPGASVSDQHPTITVAVPSDARLADLRVTVNGHDATAAARSDDGHLAVVAPAKLREGTHSVSVSFSSSNVFARTVSKKWDFTVNTSPPKLKLTSPDPEALLARRAVRFAGTAEPGSTVQVAYAKGSRSVTAAADGAWKVVARLPEGAVTATVTSTDGAGNSTSSTRRVAVDTTAPKIDVSAPARGAKITETDQPLVYGTVRSDNPRALKYTVRVNGTKVAAIKGIDAASPSSLDAGPTGRPPRPRRPSRSTAVVSPSPSGRCRRAPTGSS